MDWRVEFHKDFRPEFDLLSSTVRVEIAALIDLLKMSGPLLKRPLSDTLNGSKHANMKELRLYADGGVWRIAYAFDPERDAILLVAGDKSGIDQKRFYKSLIVKADARFDKHLAIIKSKETKNDRR